MRIEKFTPEHLDALSLQDAQAYIGQFVTPEYAAWLAEYGDGYTVIDGDYVVACAGVAKQWEGRGMAWALLAKESGRCFLPLHRAVLRYLDFAGYRRIEATVDAEFMPGHRWLMMLGFEREGRMPAYAPDGRTHDLYARIR